jgi:hypothetical protein
VGHAAAPIPLPSQKREILKPEQKSPRLFAGIFSGRTLFEGAQKMGHPPQPLQNMAAPVLQLLQRFFKGTPIAALRKNHLEKPFEIPAEKLEFLMKIICGKVFLLRIPHQLGDGTGSKKPVHLVQRESLGDGAPGSLHEMMGFVADKNVKGHRKGHPRPEGIGKEEMVVCHHHGAIQGSSKGPLHKAVLPLCAGSPQASPALGSDFHNPRMGSGEGKLFEISQSTPLCPIENKSRSASLISGKGEKPFRSELPNPGPAGIAGSSLQQRVRKIDIKDIHELGKIFLEKLLLKRNASGENQHSFILSLRMEQRRSQKGEALPHPRGSLRSEKPLLGITHVPHRLGKLLLRKPGAVPLKFFCKNPGGPEKGEHLFFGGFFMDFGRSDGKHPLRNLVISG